MQHSRLTQKVRRFFLTLASKKMSIERLNIPSITINTEVRISYWQTSVKKKPASFKEAGFFLLY